MFIIGPCLVSEDLFDEYFVCDLHACKGACCVEGESGAPLEEDELPLLESALEASRPWMTAEGIDAIQKKGLYTRDADGDLVTTLVGDQGACAYAWFDDKGTAFCAFEKAFEQGQTNWKKPISCHLYPVRLGRVGDYISVNYHRWQLCAPACSCGVKLGVPVFRFLRSALERRFGADWYAELNTIYEERKKQRK
ncbi:MAG: DUF3109 family protein [Flavobacteriales bacterium]|nr:DUF3109 family protein [Flavobacteriales bacterium]